MNDSKISVVIPLYNKAGTIKRCLDSVLAQTSAPHEVIVLDDGSQDTGLARAKQYQAQHPELNLRVLVQSNQGVAAARNAAIKAASCDYIALLDADDTFEPEFISEIKTLICSFRNARVFCTRYTMQYQDGSQRRAKWQGIRQMPKRGLMQRYFKMAANGDLPISASSVCIHKDAIKRAGGFPYGQQMGEDQWLWSVLALNETIAYSSRSLATYYAQVTDSLMQSLVPNQELPYSAMLQDLVDTRTFSYPLKRDIRAMIRTHLYDLVRRNFLSQQPHVCDYLLQDHRLQSWRLRTLYWRIKLHASRFTQRVNTSTLDYKA